MFIAQLIAPALLAIFPIAIALLAGRRTLRLATADRTAAWFGYWRLIQWLLIVVVVGWFGAMEMLRIDDFLALVLPSAGSAFPRLPGWAMIRFVPAALISMVVMGLSRSVQARLLGIDYTRKEIVGQAVYSQAVIYAPLLLALGGMDSLLEGKARLAAGLFAAAFIAWQFLIRKFTRAMELTPHALTVGELRDRAFALAEKAGVKLRQLYLLPIAKGRMANALATSGNNVLLTDYLLRKLGKREVDAVIAHELGHLKRRDLRKRALAFVATVAAAVMLGFTADASRLLPAGFPAFSLFILLAILAQFFVSRRNEYGADRVSAELTGDPEAMITALARVTRLSYFPLQWGKWSERGLTHPSTTRRAQRLATAAGIPPERLPQLLELTSAEPEECYPITLPPEGKVFSTTFKLGVQNRVTWSLLAGIVIPPCLTAFAIEAAFARQAPAWLAYLAGLAFTLAVFLTLVNYIPASGTSRLAGKIRDRLRGPGFDPDEQQAVCVGLSPGVEPRLYEHNWTWDAGLAVFSSERLCYLGEEVRFALDRRHVAGLELTQGPPAWWRCRTVLVNWRLEDGASGAFTLRPFGPRSLRAMDRETARLFRKLETWRQGTEHYTPLPAQLASLAPPSNWNVTGISPAEISSRRKLTSMTVFIAIAATIAALLFGLRFFDDPAFTAGLNDAAPKPLLGWCVVLVAVSMSVFQVLPFRRYVSRQAKRKPPRHEDTKKNLVSS